MQYIKPACLILCFLFMPWLSTVSDCSDLKTLTAGLGNNDAVIVKDSYGNILLSHNPEKKLVPASILKIFTTLLAFHSLGKDFRFETAFYLDTRNNLIVKGYGDPLLISEELKKLSKNLKKKLGQTSIVNDIVLDASYFKEQLTIPGVNESLDPYNAPNGALCVNFNTVYFKKNLKTGQYESAEPQTPILPFVLKRIKSSPLSKDRIFLSQDHNDHILYAGHLIKYFLEKENISFKGEVRMGTVNKEEAHLVYTFKSGYTVEEITEKLLYFSNNYIANQLFLCVGAKEYGPPGTLEKGTKAARHFAEKEFGLKHLQIYEGSGISRKNKITAKEMMDITDAFKPYFYLLKKKGCRYYKTGTLHHVSTQAGFIETRDKGLCQFVIMMNGTHANAEKWVQKLLKEIK